MALIGILPCFNISSHINWKVISSCQKKKLDLTKDSDGEFYMSFNRDFLKYFGELELVHLTPGRMAEEDSSKKWDVFPFRGMWKGETAGGCGNDAISKNRYSAGFFYCFFSGSFARNPQLLFSLTDPDQDDDSAECSVILSLAQKPAGSSQQVVKRKNEYSVGFRIYKVRLGNIFTRTIQVLLCRYQQGRSSYLRMISALPHQLKSPTNTST